jgi:hypothetical protein
VYRDLRANGCKVLPSLSCNLFELIMLFNLNKESDNLANGNNEKEAACQINNRGHRGSWCFPHSKAPSWSTRLPSHMGASCVSRCMFIRVPSGPKEWHIRKDGMYIGV